MPLDIKLSWDIDAQHAKFSILNNDVATDMSLLTPVIVSLFTDARAAKDDILPDERDSNRRGWWGDSTNPENPDDSLGSKLWLLERSKVTQKNLNDAKQYVEDALKWMLDEGIAKEINVFVENQSLIATTNVLAFRVEIVRPDDITETFKFIEEWEASANLT